MAGVIVSLGPSLAEEWWSTEPQLHQLDYEAAPNETAVEGRSSRTRPHLHAVD